VATAVFFHAHPDDEAITTGGTMARAAAEGHRVVLVVATDGRHGEVPDDLGPDETLVDRRRVELQRSADALGVASIRWLGYQDSGMAGWPQNDDPAAFCQADLDEAAGRLAAILTEEAAAVLTTYDWHGNYGHPDHLKVHTVGHRAAELAGTAQVYEATVNRDAVFRLMAMAREEAEARGETIDLPDLDDTDDGEPLGMPESTLTTAVDVAPYLALKRSSIRAHASQVTDTSFFLTMPDEVFAAGFGTEWFIHEGEPAGVHETWLAGLDERTAWRA
jgi:LmbE family N-acetylglucosaminyl deacetylase